MELSDFMRLRESDRLEAKDARGGLPRSMWETYSAFANTAGGTILLGVEELPDRSLRAVGVGNPDAMVDDLWNALNNSQKASVNVLDADGIAVLEIDDKRVVAVKVPRADRRVKPVFVNNNPLTGTYRRNHGGDYRCRYEEIQSMMRDAATESQDAKVIDTQIDELDRDTIRRYRNIYEGKHEGHPWNGLSDEEFLRCIGAAAEGVDGELRPTGAGLLMFGKEWNIVRAFPHYFLDYRQQINPDNRWEDRFTSQTGDWSGNLFDFYQRAYNKLKQALKVPFQMEGIYRIDDTPAHRALREALANCLTNANYYERRGVVCLWEADALSLANPGDFRVDIERAMKGGVSDPRNEALMKIFALVDIGERAGSGLPKIFGGWVESGYPAPSFEEEFGPDRTTLMLPLAERPRRDNAGSAIGDKVKKSDQKERSKRAIKKSGQKERSKSVPASGVRAERYEANKQAIIDFLTSEGKSRSLDIAAAIGLSKTRTNEILKHMIEDGTIRTEGTTHDRTYLVNDAE